MFSKQHRMWTWLDLVQPKPSHLLPQCQELHACYIRLPARHRTTTVQAFIQLWSGFVNLSGTTSTQEFLQFLTGAADVLTFYIHHMKRMNTHESNGAARFSRQLHLVLTFVHRHLKVFGNSSVLDKMISWVRGKNLIWALYRQFSYVRPIQVWKQRFESLSINPANYTPQWYQAEFVVYVMVNPKSVLCYVGSTSVSMTNRHASRKRKLQQLEKQEFVSCELALRFWSRHKNFHDYVPIVYRRLESTHVALAHEASDICIFQTQLNMPFIKRVLQLSDKKTSPAQTGSRSHFPGHRFLRRLRLKHKSPHERTKLFLFRQKLTIYQLGSNTVERFYAMKRLWAKNCTKLELYKLIRLCRHIDAPYQARAEQALHRLCRRHNMHFPNSPKALVIPFLSNPTFKTDLRKILQESITKHRPQLFPLHWPSTTVVEGKHRQLGDCIYNWRMWHKKFLIRTPVTCNCKEFLQMYPEAPSVEGHLAGAMSDIGLSPPLHVLTKASAKDSFYPSKQNFCELMQRQLDNWSDANNNAPRMKATAIVHKLWPAHLQCLQVDPRYTFKDIVQLKQTFEELMIHSEDHAATKFCVYCPKLYFDVNKSTFADRNIFGHLDSSPSEVQANFKHRIPNLLLNEYPWAFAFHRPLPTSYLLLKGKKRYKKGRPIISYDKTICSRFYSMIGKLLTDLLPRTYPEAFGHKSIEQNFSSISQFLEDDNFQENLEMHNDDLVGFFVSVPHDRIMEALQHFVSTYFRSQCQGQVFEDITFTVDLTPGQKIRTIRGRTCKQNKHTKTFMLCHLIPAVRFSLEQGIFENLGQCFFQTRGSSIGSQCSPAICAIVVTYCEHLWVRNYQIVLDSTVLFLRYVDNRLIILPAHIAQQAPFQELLRLDFYGLPIELEECGSRDYLGFRLDLTQRTCRYIFPEQPYQFPCSCNAGTQTRVLSGFTSRAHLIIRRTVPKDLVRIDLQKLVSLYSKQGFKRSVLQCLVSRILRKQQSSRA